MISVLLDCVHIKTGVSRQGRTKLNVEIILVKANIKYVLTAAVKVETKIIIIACEVQY